MSTSTNKWRSATIDFPVFAKWDDAELETHFIGRDGCWSATTRAIQRALGSELLDLNAGWASVSTNWTCPACTRSKREIARLTAAGVILTRLEEHHDHIGDLINSELRAQAGQRWPQLLPAGAGKLANFAESLVRRFEPDLICHDCNLADGKAKIQLKALPRAFSFSPAEIGRFIKVTPNREHQIDVEAAAATWAEVRPSFEANAALAEMLAMRIATQQLVQEQALSAAHGRRDAVTILDLVHQRVVRAGDGLYSALRQDLEAFERRSLARDGTATGSPKARAKLRELPSEADVAAHDGNGSPGLWQSVPEDWRCPGCDRSRLGILRPARKPPRRWSGRLHQHHHFILADWDEPEPLIETHHNLLICGDCAAILTGVKQRHSDLSHHEAHIQIADMRAVARAEDHQAHQVDWPAAEARVRANLEWSKAVENYCAMVREAHSWKNLLDDYTRKWGEDAAMRALYLAHKREYRACSDHETNRSIRAMLAIAADHPPL